MAPPAKSSDRRKRTVSKERESGDLLSLNLWVGDLAPDTVYSDLMEIFREYGAMDALTSYSPRTYAFVFFRNTEDAKKARDEVRGSVVRGSAIKVEFARPAKPGKHLWIGGVSSSVMEEELEDELLQFGKLEMFRFLRDRNSAMVGYCKLDDAIAAQKSMDGKTIGGEQVRADFQKPQTQRPQASRRDGYDIQNPRGSRRSTGLEGTWMAPNEIGNYRESSHQGTKRHLPQGGRQDGPPSNTLWVGYPPSFHMDEQMLHNAMILFGEIERIKSFPSRHYSFVEFRSVDEARRAKEGLQGRLFGDPRIQIMFSSSELAPGKDSAPLLPGYRGARPDTSFNEAQFGSMEYFGPSHPMASNSFTGHFIPNGPRPSMLMKSQSTQGFDLLQGDLELHDFIPDGNPNAPNWRRSSPAPGVNSSSLGMRQPIRSIPNAWDDGFDMREPKRSRLDGSPSSDAPFYGRRVRSEAMGDMFGPIHPERDFSGPSHLNPVVPGPTRLRGSPDLDHCWRGVIAKGGSPVCHARCVPIGKGLESPLPEVVNCFARTDLDMLTKHYTEASGFDIVFFLPDSEEDFASYTEFLQYLGLKNRVGVAKCDDGTTLFLVPPSDFLTEVLKVSGPERLYGVVLKLPHQSTNETQRPQATLSRGRYGEQTQEVAPQNGHVYMPAHEDPALRRDYGRGLHDNLVSRAAVGHADDAYSVPSASQDYLRNPQATSQIGVSLTPELIATLASLIPSSNQSSTAGGNHMPLGHSSTSSSFPASVTSAPSMPVQGWAQESQGTFSAAQSELIRNTQQQIQQFGGQYNIQAQSASQLPTYSNLPNGLDNSVRSAVSGLQVQGFASSMPQVSVTPPRQLENIVSSNGQSLVASNQHYQHDSSFDSYNARGILRATDSMNTLNQPAQQTAPSSSHTQGQNANMQNQMGSNGMQQIQMTLNSSGNSISQGDAERTQRYQSTLQFAASLLQRIQQQQQGSSQAAGGSGNQQ